MKETALDVLKKVRLILETPESVDIVEHSKDIMSKIKHIASFHSVVRRKLKSLKSDECRRDNQWWMDLKDLIDILN